MAARQNHRSIGLPEVLVRALSGPRAISLSAYLYLLPFGIFVTINSYTSIAPELSLQFLFLTGVLGMVAVGVVLALARVGLASSAISHSNRTAYVLVVYALAGIARSVITYQQVVANSEVSYSFGDLLRNSMLGTMHGLVWLSMFSVLLTLADEYRLNRSRLAQLQKQMSEYMAQAESNLVEDIDQVQEMIRLRLQPVLQRVTQQIQVSNPASTSLLTAAEELRQTCENEVRNLSHRLSEPFTENEEKFQLAEQISWRKLISPRFFQAELHLIPIYGVTFYLGAFQVIAQRRPDLLIHNLISMIFGLIISLLLVEYFWRRFVWQWRILQVAVIHSFSVCAIWFVLVQDFGYQAYPDLRNQVILQLPLSFVALWIIFSFLSGFQAFGAEVAEERRKLEQLFRTEQQQYRVKRTRLRNLLSKLLHGNVQGGLAAVSLALVSSQSSQDDRQRELIDQAELQLRKVQSDLNKILALELSDADFSSSELKLSIDSIQTEIAQWKGLIEVEIKLDEPALEIADSAGLNNAVLTAIRESLQNSVRHGHARNVEITLQVVAEELVLEIKDDGVFELSEPITDGHGGREISALGGSRDITRVDGLTTVRVSWDISALA